MKQCFYTVNVNTRKEATKTYGGMDPINWNLEKHGSLVTTEILRKESTDM